MKATIGDADSFQPKSLMLELEQPAARFAPVLL